MQRAEEVFPAAGRPLVHELGNEVEWDVLTTEAGSCLNTQELVAWYNTIDLYVVTSSGEGGPQGPFEAAACGCVVLSTDVGQVSDWRELRTSGLIVPTYRNAAEATLTVADMAYEIRTLIADRDKLNYLSNHLQSDIRTNWNAAVLCPQQLRELFAT